ncbi:hypothetical protein D3C72_687650 [compost metagenome]
MLIRLRSAVNAFRYSLEERPRADRVFTARRLVICEEAFSDFSHLPKREGCSADRSAIN